MVATPKKNSVDSTQDNPEVLEPFDTLPPSTIEDECHVSNSAADGSGDEEPPHPSRDERLEKHRMQCQNLIAYLTTNLCPSGLTKKEVRNIKNQAKTHQWDIKSKIFNILPVQFIYLATLCS
jgi:hypothetical protein